MINSIIDSHYGCHLNRLNVSCIFYADDILLISASVSGLQNLLEVCSLASVQLGLTFNVKKSSCIAFGALASKVSEPLNLGSEIISWNRYLKYLGANFISGKKLKPDIDKIKSSFFAACNNILSNASHCNEILHLNLQETYVLPILLYACPALNFTCAQSDTLSVCWNSVYRRIFGFNRWESVKLFIAGLGRLDLKHLILWRKICFLKGILAAGKSLLVDCLTFMKGNEWSVVLYDDLLVDVSLSKYDLYRQIVAHFNTVAGFNLA